MWTQGVQGSAVGQPESHEGNVDGVCGSHGSQRHKSTNQRRYSLHVCMATRDHRKPPKTYSSLF